MRDLLGNDYVALSKFRTEGVHETQSAEGMTDATLIAAALDANTQATLALAFEQRTANLVHAHEVSLRSQSASPLADLHAQIVVRLGLNRDTQ